MNRDGDWLAQAPRDLQTTKIDAQSVCSVIRHLHGVGR